MRAGATRVVVIVIALAATGSPLLAGAESLGEIARRGYLEACAHPDALPYSGQNVSPQGFQLDIGQQIAADLGVRLHVDWIVFTRHARLMNCDAVLGAIVADDGKQPPGAKLTIPYASSGWVLVLPTNAAAATRFEDAAGDKGVGVQYASWAHYTLDTRKIRTRQYANDLDIMEAVSRGEIAAGAVVDAYAGWYLHLHPRVNVQLAQGYTPEPELRWNVAVSLRGADQALLDAVNGILTRRIADGTISGIFARYGIAYVPPLPMGPRTGSGAGHQ